MRSSYKARILVGANAIVFLMACAATASASDNMYKTENTIWYCFNGTAKGAGLYCQTDNRTVTVWRQSTVSSYKKRLIKSVLQNEYAPTDLVIKYPSHGDYHGGSETDIVYQVKNGGFSGTEIGKTWCNDAVNGELVKCDQEYIRFRPGAQFDKELICHETGHAVGLTHGNDAFPREPQDASELACMETPDSTNRPHLGSHNRSEINSTY